MCREGTVRKASQKKWDSIFACLLKARPSLEMDIYHADLTRDDGWVEAANGCTYGPKPKPKPKPKPNPNPTPKP